MLIDETFWLELDRRLKPMFKAVNDKIGQVSDRLDTVSDRLDTVNANVTTLNNWTKRQDNCIEGEITQALLAHLVSEKMGFLTIKDPMRFPKTINDKNGNRITEFDGIIVLTNSHELCTYLKGKASKESLPKHFEAYIIIVEAKQNLTTAKLRNKIKQRARIMQLLKFYKANPSLMPADLGDAMFDRFSTSVGLFIGGQDIETNVLHAMRRFMETPDVIPDVVYVQGDSSNNSNTQSVLYDIFAQTQNGRHQQVQEESSRKQKTRGNDDASEAPPHLAPPSSLSSLQSTKDLCGVITLNGNRFHVAGDERGKFNPAQFSGFRGGAALRRHGMQ